MAAKTKKAAGKVPTMKKVELTPEAEALMKVAQRLKKANPGVAKAIQTAADRRNYLNRQAGWPVKEK